MTRYVIRRCAEGFALFHDSVLVGVCDSPWVLMVAVTYQVQKGVPA